MKRVASLVLTFAVLLTTNADAQAGGHEPLETINPVVGDQSFVERFGRAPNATDSESLRIATHLEWAEGELRSANTDHLSDAQAEERARLLDALSDYRQRGAFPINDQVEGRRPRFVDHEGTRCAVGHLLEVAEGREAVMAINESHEWDLLLEMNEPALAAFANDSGFTLVELAMIQPTYGWVPPQNVLDRAALRREVVQSMQRVGSRCDAFRRDGRRRRRVPMRKPDDLVVPMPQVPQPRPVSPRVQRTRRARRPIRPRRPVVTVTFPTSGRGSLVQVRNAPRRYASCLDQVMTRDLLPRLRRYAVPTSVTVTLPLSVNGVPNELTQERLDQVANQITARVTECRTNVEQRVRIILNATRARGITSIVQVRPARNRACVEAVAQREIASITQPVRRSLTARRNLTIPAGSIAPPPPPPVAGYSDARARAMIDGNAWAIRQCIGNQPGLITLTVQVGVDGQLRMMGATLPPGLGDQQSLSCIAGALARIRGADRPARPHTLSHDLSGP